MPARRSTNIFPAIRPKTTRSTTGWWGMPWFTDAGVLYTARTCCKKYNAKAPETWEELTAIAQKDPGR